MWIHLLRPLDTAGLPPHSGGMVIPHTELAAETLRAVIEDFVTRDGSIQGHAETPLEQKIAAVMKLLQTGEAAVVFDPEDETCTIAMKNSLGREHRLPRREE